MLATASEQIACPLDDAGLGLHRQLSLRPRGCGTVLGKSTGMSLLVSFV